VADGTESWSHTRDTAQYGMGKHTIFIRAFDGNKYSDVISMEFTIVEKDPGEDEKDDGGFLPGFEGIIMIGALGLVLILSKKRNEG